MRLAHTRKGDSIEYAVYDRGKKLLTGSRDDLDCTIRIGWYVRGDISLRTLIDNVATCVQELERGAQEGIYTPSELKEHAPGIVVDAPRDRYTLPLEGLARDDVHANLGTETFRELHIYTPYADIGIGTGSVGTIVTPENAVLALATHQNIAGPAATLFWRTALHPADHERINAYFREMFACTYN